MSTQRDLDGSTCRHLRCITDGIPWGDRADDVRLAPGTVTVCDRCGRKRTARDGEHRPHYRDGPYYRPYGTRGKRTTSA